MHFYQNNLLHTKVSTQGNLQIFRMQDIALAQLEQKQAPKLLLTDDTKSVIGMPPNLMTYSPYGYPHATHWKALLAYHGYWYDPLTFAYLLGNGYRLFNPHLMRFCSQDSMSPFGRGGLNPYAYCNGDPVNNADANGHFWNPFRKDSQYYQKKLLNLAAKKPKIRKEIRRYMEKTDNLISKKKEARYDAQRANPETHQGILDRSEYEYLIDKVKNNKAKLLAQTDKLERLIERITRNEAKLLAAQNLDAPQAPMANNAPPEKASPSQQQVSIRQPEE